MPACHSSPRPSCCSRRRTSRRRRPPSLPPSHASASSSTSTPGCPRRSSVSPSRRRPGSGPRTASTSCAGPCRPSNRRSPGARCSACAWPAVAHRTTGVGRVRSGRSSSSAGGRSRSCSCTTTRSAGRSADSVAFGLREEQWPPALRDRVLGRIVGRVLAHEIGHFVLRSPRHASRGLMRPIQYVAELIAGNGELFGLTPEDLNLLRAAMTLGARCRELGGSGTAERNLSKSSTGDRRP